MPQATHAILHRIDSGETLALLDRLAFVVAEPTAKFCTERLKVLQCGPRCGVADANLRRHFGAAFCSGLVFPNEALARETTKLVDERREETLDRKLFPAKPQRVQQNILASLRERKLVDCAQDGLNRKLGGAG